MNRIQLFVVALLSGVLSIYGTTLHVGMDQTYTTIQSALDVVVAGDTILLHKGIHAGGSSISGINGLEDEPIVIVGEGSHEAIIQGGSNAIQFSDVHHIVIENVVIREQTGNGLNIDDAGTFDTPTHHVTIRNVWFGPMAATGNNDELKMSGVDFFTIDSCTFTDGSAGGSGIDMVGCHQGIIQKCLFKDQGSNSIQCKGGTANIIIRWNTFVDGGARAINLGGMTGLAFFRPQNATYEAKWLSVYGNIFKGSEAAVAYVGSENVEVFNNTMLNQTKWVIRILQETVDESRFVPCRNNVFSGNLVITDHNVSTHCNIGPNTASETFTFNYNLWYNQDDASSSQPTGIASHPTDISGIDPLIDVYSIPGSERLAAIPKENSVVIGAVPVVPDMASGIEFNDMFGRSLALMIGAFAPLSTTSIVHEGHSLGEEELCVRFYDVTGREYASAPYGPYYRVSFGMSGKYLSTTLIYR